MVKMLAEKVCNHPNNSKRASKLTFLSIRKKTLVHHGNVVETKIQMVLCVMNSKDNTPAIRRTVCCLSMRTLVKKDYGRNVMNKNAISISFTHALVSRIGAQILLGSLFRDQIYLKSKNKGKQIVTKQKLRDFSSCDRTKLKAVN